MSTIKYTSQNGVLATERYFYTNGYLTSVKTTGTTIFELNSEDNYGHTSSVNTLGRTRNYGFTVSGLPTSRNVVYGNQTLQSLTYSFNAATGNLTSRYNAINGLTENFTYDNMHRLTNYGGTVVTYDNNGNIATKGDVGSFTYNTPGKPYAVSDVTLNNPISVGTQDVSYCSFDRPSTITGNGYTANFTYNGNYDRVKMQMLHNNSTTLTRYYLGGCYELDVKPSSTKEKLYLYGGYYDAPVVIIKQSGSTTYYNILRDHLGSITNVQKTNEQHKLSYDAWGRLRDPSNHSLYTLDNEPEPFLGRGYCGHEHLTGLGLINMNARLYDPLIGRFLSPDPYIQAPNHSQSFNRYSYCMNNPLKYTDPSGDIFLEIGLGLLGAYIFGASVNKGELNPIKWNWNNEMTYLGMAFGAVFGAMGGYGILHPGTISFGVGIDMPYLSLGTTIGVAGAGTNWNFDFHWTTAAGDGGSIKQIKGKEKAEKTIDNAVNSMRNNYWRTVDNTIETDPYLSNLYLGTQNINGFVYESSKQMRRISNVSNLYDPLVRKTRFVNGLFIVDELHRDYYYDGERIGFHMKKDIYKETLGGVAGSLAGYVGSLVSPYIGIPMALYSSFYMSNYAEEKAYENYIRSIQPYYEPTVGMYNFFMIY